MFKGIDKFRNNISSYADIIRLPSMPDKPEETLQSDLGYNLDMAKKIQPRKYNELCFSVKQLVDLFLGAEGSTDLRKDDIIYFANCLCENFNEQIYNDTFKRVDDKLFKQRIEYQQNIIADNKKRRSYKAENETRQAKRWIARLEGLILGKGIVEYYLQIRGYEENKEQNPNQSEQAKKGGRPIEPFDRFIKNQSEKAKKNLLSKLHSYIDGKRGKKALEPIFVAMKEGLIHKPSFGSFDNEFKGCIRRKYFDSLMNNYEKHTTQEVIETYKYKLTSNEAKSHN